MLVNGYKIEPYANLYGANLSGAKLTDANLSDAKLTGANLSGANLSGAKLTDANLSGANLYGAKLTDANLSDANLSGAKLTGANLSGANLSGAKLTGANLYGANLSDANLSGANLSQSKGLLIASEWLKQKFKFNKKGYIVYKAEGNPICQPPNCWKNSKFITEIPNPLRSQNCGCGVNFGTVDWIKNNYNITPNGETRIRRMYLHWEDLADVVVPYNTDGKARCARLEKGRLL